MFHRSVALSAGPQVYRDTFLVLDSRAIHDGDTRFESFGSLTLHEFEMYTRKIVRSPPDIRQAKVLLLRGHEVHRM